MNTPPAPMPSGDPLGSPAPSLELLPAGTSVDAPAGGRGSPAAWLTGSKAGPPGPSSSASPGGRLLGLEALLLLSLAQVLLGGYRLGVGNQAIQIPFLRHWIDPHLYARDAMVARTLGDYPSFFFRALAYVVPADGVAGAYFLLHLLTTFGVLAAVYALARAVVASRPAAFVAVLLLLAGHHRALAGDDLYSVGFTHTWAVFPLAIGSLYLFYKDRPAAACLLAGLIFNLHALTAGYLFVMFGFWGCREIKQLGWRKAAWCVALFSLAALPTALAMASRRQTFDGPWIKLTQIRSAEHSFPSAWWQANDAEVPRFALLAGFAALSLGFAAPPRQVRKSLLLGAGAALLFVVGTVFSEWKPAPWVLRAQLFRASRLLLVIVFCHAAYGIARGFARGWRVALGGGARHNAAGPSGGEPAPASAAGGRVAAPHDVSETRWSGWVELLSAAFSFLCIAVPPLLPLLPAAFVLATATALLQGRLAWPKAAAAGGVLLVCAAARRSIGFSLGGDAGRAWGDAAFAWASRAAGAAPLLALLAVAAALVALPALGLRRPWRAVVAGCGLVAYLGVAAHLYRTAGRPDPADRWQDVQAWARRNTPPDALFLTPAAPGGFRIGSERAVVGEWRDGTQAYFTADFADDWWKAMRAVLPGMLYDDTGRRLLSRGRGLGALDDAELIELCNRTKADYVVLPAARDADGADPAAPPAAPRHDLEPAYSNGAWGVFFPRKNPPPPPDADPEEAARQKFMADVVGPNIEKYRKGDARVQVVDEAGRAVYDLPYEIRQTKQAFNFGCSMAFFTNPAPEGRASDFKPPPVTEVEKQRLPEIFNFSMIPFSGKWVYVEPVEGQRHYEDMDLYTAWCGDRGIGMEFHFLSGYAPGWLRRKPAAEQQKLFVAHAADMVRRYGKQIKYWQVVNEQLLLAQSPAVFKAVREIAAEVAPDDQFGVSHCAQFYNPGLARQWGNPLFRGLDDVRWLKTQGVKVDFFGFHGHRPFGVWPDVRQMYEALDGFAREGVKIHISEFSCPLDVPILGAVRQGRFTEDLQADYYEFFYTVCFSHPSVEMINLWGMGPVTWQEGAGLLDEDAKPKPVFDSLKDLIRRRWVTNFKGKLPLDGVLSFRGFHGDYELTLTLPNGAVARAAFPLRPGPAVPLRLKLDRASGALTPA